MSRSGRPTERNQRYAERLVDAIQRGDVEGRDRIIKTAEKHGARVKNKIRRDGRGQVSVK